MSATPIQVPSALVCPECGKNSSAKGSLKRHSSLLLLVYTTRACWGQILRELATAVGGEHSHEERVDIENGGQGED
jgi:hypothetical protein